MNFEFATAGQILFGEGKVRDAARAAAGMGSRPLFVSGGNAERTGSLSAIGTVRFTVSGEPTIDLVRNGAALARAERCDMVIAAGGGSVLDAGKAIAALLTNPGDPLDYLEVVGQGKPLERAAAPCIAIPTTAGTGSEVTRNAVLASPEHQVKASLRSAGMIPRLALVDPELTAGLPRPLTASTGLDALTQLIEPYVSVRANGMTDLLCVEGLRRAAISLPRAWEDGSDRNARSGMSWASLLGGMALANAGLGAVHGFAAPVGGMFPAPHGAVCAAILPHAMEINLEALHSRAPRGEALKRYETVARLLTGMPHATAEDGAWWVSELVAKLEIPPLRQYGVSDADIPGLVEKASKASSMKGNSIVLTGEELTEIIARAI